MQSRMIAMPLVVLIGERRQRPWAVRRESPLRLPGGGRPPSQSPVDEVLLDLGGVDVLGDGLAPRAARRGGRRRTLSARKALGRRERGAPPRKVAPLSTSWGSLVRA